MRSLPLKYFLITILTLILFAYSFSIHAHFSAEVSRAMDEANTCIQAHEIYIYSECMKNNNKKLNQAIKSSTKQQTSNLSKDTSRIVNQNISKKLKENKKLCFYEKTKFTDTIAAQRRYYYCVYENLLELLINIERHIEIYK